MSGLQILLHILEYINISRNADHGHGGWPHWEVDLTLLITGKKTMWDPPLTSCFRIWNNSQTNWGPHIVDPLWMCAGKESLYWLRNFAVRKPTIVHALNHHVYGMYKPSPNGRFLALDLPHSMKINALAVYSSICWLHICGSSYTPKKDPQGLDLWTYLNLVIHFV